LVAKKVKKLAKKKAPANKVVASKKAAPKTTKAKSKTAVKKASPKRRDTKKATKQQGAVEVPRSARKVSKDEQLTPEEIEGYRRLLLEKRAELLGDVKYIENEALKKSRLDAAGDLSSMPIHMADLGTDNFEQEFSLGLMDGERKILSEIVAALGRIADGTFGICEGTGRPISKARLQASPWACFCIDYARMVEKGLIAEGEKVRSAAPKHEESFDDETDELEEDSDVDFEEETPRAEGTGVFEDAEAEKAEDEDVDDFGAADEKDEAEEMEL